MVYQPSIDGISGIYLRGKAGPARWAQVEVRGKDTLEFSHPDIADLETVAYGQAVNSHETLFNSAGLPACPFIVNPPKGGEKKTDALPPYRMLAMKGENNFHMLTNEVIKAAVIEFGACPSQRLRFPDRRTGENRQRHATDSGARRQRSVGEKLATVPVTAYVPKEWKGVEVMIGDTYYITFVNGGAVSKGLVRTGGKLLKTTEITSSGAGSLRSMCPSTAPGSSLPKRARRPISGRSTGTESQAENPPGFETRG